MDTRKAVSHRLLELCEKKKLSVNALARISAVPPSTLKNIINGGSQNAGIVTLKNCVTAWRFHYTTSSTQMFSKTLSKK